MNTGNTTSLLGIHFINPYVGWTVGEAETIMKYKAPVVITFTDTMVNPGDTATIPVFISGIESFNNIFSFQYTIGFDTTVIELIGLDTTGFLVSEFTLDSSFTTDDTFVMAGAREDPFAASGTFIQLKFELSDTAYALDTINILFDEFILNEDFPLVYIQPGKLFIAGPLYGDVSLNRFIESFDASLVLQYLVEKISLSDTALTAAEVSGNGIIMAYDASLIIRFVAGYITDFDAGYMFAPKEAYSNSIAYLEKDSENDQYVEYTLHLRNVKDVYSSEISIEFSNLEIKACENTELTENYLIKHKAADGVLKIVLAGYEPIQDEGEIVKLRFRKLTGEGTIKLNEVVVNETKIAVSGENLSLLPDRYDLNQNYPNPFNSETIIKYQLPENSKVEISIYNVLGQKIRILVNTDMKAGYHSVKWNGRNDAGIIVASGLYIMRIRANNFGKTKKMIYLR